MGKIEAAITIQRGLDVNDKTVSTRLVGVINYNNDLTDKWAKEIRSVLKENSIK